MKKQLITLSLCAALCLTTMTACGNTVQPRDNDESTPNNQSTQIPNPFVDYDTLDEAQKAAGFDITLPEAVADSDSVVYRAIDGKMLEVIYYLGDNEVSRIRKAPCSEDISGDYNTYDTTDTAAVENVEITMKGNNDVFSVATWNDGDYSYSVSIKDGISSEALLNIVKAVK